MKDVKLLKGISFNIKWSRLLFIYALVLLIPIIDLLTPTFTIAGINISKSNNIFEGWLAISLNSTNTSTLIGKILLFLSIANLGYFIAPIKFFTEFKTNLSEDNFFDKNNEVLARRIGYCLKKSGYIFICIEISFLIINHKVFSYRFYLFLLIISVGSFFIFLADVFKRARKLKEENDLTI